jgi:amino acid adenylation domain-containing protein
VSTEGQGYPLEDVVALGEECRLLLERMNVQPGDPILILLAPGPELVLSMLALAEHCLAAPVDPGLGLEHICRVLDDLNPVAVVVGPGPDGALRDRLEESNVPLLRLEDGPRLVPEVALPAEGRGGKPAQDSFTAGLLLRTSGTTGEPRWVALKHRQLLHAAGNIADSLCLGPDDRYLCVLPCFHIHGFSTVLAALLTGGAAVVSGELRPEELLQLIAAQSISWLSATPTHYRALLRTGDVGRMKRPGGKLRLVRSASAPMSRQLTEELSSALAVPVVQAYGMTEAGPLIATNSIQPGGNRPGSVGRPLGVELTIDGGEEAGNGAGTGEICIRGDALSSGYWPAGPQLGSGAGGWFRTGDLGYLDADGFLFVTGRVRDIINAGGEKLLPAEIEAVLQQHPAVAEAAVYPAPHDSLGEAPHAVVVLGEGFATPEIDREFEAKLGQAIRQFCLSRLPRYMLPHRINVRDAIPRNRAGKVERQQLYASVSAPDTGEQSPPGGQGSLSATLLDLWRAQLRMDNIGHGENFFELGGDSLSAAQLTLHVEERFGVHLDDDFVYRCPTIELQAGYLESTARQRPGQFEAGGGVTAFDEFAPLSPGQQRLWFLDQVGSGTEYNMSAPVWLSGEFRLQWFEAALADLVARHGALRTRFRQRDGQPVQYMEQHWQPRLEIDDLAHLSAEEQESAVLSLAARDRNCDFNLSRSPPARYRLVRLAPRRHAFILTVHHIICDGWSVSIFYRDLLLLYARHAGMEDASLPAIRLDYPHYCRGQVAAQEGEHARQQLAWWMTQLRGVSPWIALGRQRTSHNKERTGCKTVPFEIPGGLTAGLNRLSLEWQTGVFPMLMAGLQVALHVLSGQSAFCVGTAVANRRKREFENLFGFFANTLPIPARIDPEQSLRQFVNRVAGDCRGAGRHGDVDFGAIVRELEPARTAGRNPLVQVMFAYQNYPSLDSLLQDYHGPLQAESFSVEADRTKFDLTLYVKPRAGRLEGLWQFRHPVLEQADIKRLQAIFLDTLESIVGSGGLSVGEVSDRQRERNLPRPAQRSAPPGLLQVMRQRAVAEPTATALRAGATAVSYGQLVDRVEQMARRLSSRGIAAGDRVGVILERSDEAVVTPLALFALGAVYLPLDSGYPTARLVVMARDAEVRALITGSEGAAIVADIVSGLDHEPLLISLSDDPAAELPDSPGFELVDPDPDCAAYIIFTSGTMGRPKGVVISHANLRHYLAAMSDELEIGAGDTWLHTASQSFSSSIRQFALPLYAGGAVYMAQREDVLNVEKIPQLVQSGEVTVLDLVPSHWRNLLRGLQLSGCGGAVPDLSSLRLLLSASEALPAPLAKAIVEQFPFARLVNMYGQSETSGILFIEHSPSAEGDGTVSLGRPLAGIEVAIIGEDGMPVREGSEGEICVSGPTIGQGYVAGGVDKQLQPLPVNRSGFYRTGDLGRRDVDGNMHFSGRTDAQIKYRGFRIEPGDIESAASRHTGVADAAVCLAASPGRVPHLHVLVVPEGESPYDNHLWTRLQAFLREQLPGHMVPSACTLVPSLPRTLSGKLDRRALPDLAVPGLETAGDRPGSADSIADKLGAIWAEVLALENVDHEDNFFDLGGDSLSSIEVVSLAMDEGIDLSLEQLFQYQTIQRLSAVIAEDEALAALDRPQPDSACARYDVDSLKQFAVEALTHAGLEEEGARIVAEVQLESSLRGQVTHNIGDIPRYARRLVRGVLNGRPMFEFCETSPVSATLDGDNAPGQWVATLAMERAIALAERSGVGIVGVRRSNHFGAAGQYAWQATRSGYIGMCFTNGPVILAPTGGTTPLFGNNPLAIGVPRGSEDPLVLDIAMSVATRGKIGLTVSEGQPLDSGWILDAAGRPSTALNDLAAGLARPIGGHKGYGLAFMIEILAGALTGAGYCADHGRQSSGRHGGTDIGHLFVVIDPDTLMGSGEFLQRLDDIVAQTRSSGKVDGVEEIFVPGEMEFRARSQNLTSGIPLPDTLVERLQDYAEAHSLRHGPLPMDEPQRVSASER